MWIGNKRRLAAVAGVLLLGTVVSGCPPRVGGIREPSAPTGSTVRPGPETDRQVIDTVRNINQAFIRGDIQTLDSLVHKELTMLHGHMGRIESKDQAMDEWRGLFRARAATGVAYFIRESNFKIQYYGNVVVVTFDYEHPAVIRGRVGTEGGKAVYVLLFQDNRWQMVHCSTIRNVAPDERHPLREPIP